MPAAKTENGAELSHCVHRVAELPVVAAMYDGIVGVYGRVKVSLHHELSYVYPPGSGPLRAPVELFAFCLIVRIGSPHLSSFHVIERSGSARLPNVGCRGGCCETCCRPGVSSRVEVREADRLH
jgi:hypothetical protein